jgi:hypothetical protein
MQVGGGRHERLETIDDTLGRRGATGAGRDEKRFEFGIDWWIGGDGPVASGLAMGRREWRSGRDLARVLLGSGRLH